MGNKTKMLDSTRNIPLIEMARLLVREEALFAGTSTGANIVAAIWVAARLGTGHSCFWQLF
ncbi:MAG: hypothetical protein A2097_04185 [Desulfobacula sp. GWF2_41_7]|nr:MAG: hypothetical protein A2097_04185 [Desulfobacula sp. GWF2_41_7]